MGPRTTTEKDARRLRVLKLMWWIGCAFATGWGIVQAFDPKPGLWKAAAVNAVAAVFYALLPQLMGRVASLTAMVTTSIFTYAYIFIIISLLGTGSGVSMYHRCWPGSCLRASVPNASCFRHSLAF